MSRTPREEGVTFRYCAGLAALVLLVLLLLPFLGVVGLMLQFAFVLGAPVLLLVGMVYAFVTPAER